jgi:hypothetical protein
MHRRTAVADGALYKGSYAYVSAVSSGSAGTRAAGGSYSDRPYRNQGFVVNQSG